MTDVNYYDLLLDMQDLWLVLNLPSIPEDERVERAKAIVKKHIRGQQTNKSL